MQSYWPCHWADLKPKHSTPFYQILRQHDSAPWNGGWLSSNHNHLLQVFNLYIRHNECVDFEVGRLCCCCRCCLVSHHLLFLSCSAYVFVVVVP